MTGALTAPASMALSCRWRSRPQHQVRTTAGSSSQAVIARLVAVRSITDARRSCFRFERDCHVAPLLATARRGRLSGTIKNARIRLAQQQESERGAPAQAAPTEVNRRVAPRRRPNAEVRSCEHSRPPTMIEAAKKGRHGYRD